MSACVDVKKFKHVRQSLSTVVLSFAKIMRVEVGLDRMMCADAPSTFEELGIECERCRRESAMSYG